MKKSESQFAFENSLEIDKSYQQLLNKWHNIVIHMVFLDEHTSVGMLI